MTTKPDEEIARKILCMLTNKNLSIFRARGIIKLTEKMLDDVAISIDSPKKIASEILSELEEKELSFYQACSILDNAKLHLANSSLAMNNKL